MMTNEQRLALLGARQDLLAEFMHANKYIRAIVRGNHPDSKLPPAIKARVDAAIAKHHKKP